MVMLRALGGDVASKTFRTDTPNELKEYCENLLKYDPKQRPNWEKLDLIKTLSDIRQSVFGRRHCFEAENLKGGAS